MLLSLNQNGYSVKIDSIGAELKSFQNADGKEYIWTSDPVFWKSSSPLLFPLIGNVRDGKTIIHGNEYAIPKHGFVKDMDFAYEMQGASKVTFTCKDTAETLACYPYHFTLRLTYELLGSSLHMTYEVVNNDSETMYYHLGAHPGFLCPLEEDERFSDYVLRFPQKETCLSPVYDIQNLCFDSKNRRCHLQDTDMLPLHHELFCDDAIVFEHLRSQSVQIVNPVTEKGVQVDFPGFTTIAFWTPYPKQAPFLCAEPWNGAAIFDDEDNELKHKRDIQTLQADEARTYGLALHLLE